MLCLSLSECCLAVAVGIGWAFGLAAFGVVSGIVVLPCAFKQVTISRDHKAARNQIGILIPFPRTNAKDDLFSLGICTLWG